MKRVLITGSRTWQEPERIGKALREAYLKLGPFTLVSGACPQGADAQAEAIQYAAGLAVEKHPADWEEHGKRAGFLRNAEMVRLGADLCLAFIKDESRGASMTADLAEKAGIETLRFTA